MATLANAITISRFRKKPKQYFRFLESTPLPEYTYASQNHGPVRNRGQRPEGARFSPVSGRKPALPPYSGSSPQSLLNSSCPLPFVMQVLGDKRGQTRLPVVESRSGLELAPWGATESALESPDARDSIAGDLPDGFQIFNQDGR
jgi:hypothetical protein